MRKILIALLFGVLATATFAQAPSDKSAPQLSDSQKLQLMKMQVKFNNISQQMKSLQDEANKMKDEYASISAGLCKSSDGKKYQVAFGDEPYCVVAQEAPPAKK